MRKVKPKFVDPFAVSGNDALSCRPPILFREVTARVFPLKANMARLTLFCDQYLNMDIPDTIVRFTPALPYVYFMVLNYGGMSATTMEAQRLGWVAQHEILFLVPLQRWRREHGKLAFEGWTSVSPFIFVDDPMSQTTGREVYGWPKVQAWIDADKPLWATHPRTPTRMFTMSTNVFADVYAGQEEPARELVTVDRDMVASYAEFPADLNCPWSITSVIPNMIRNSLSLMGEAIDITAGLRARGYPLGRDLNSVLAMTGEAFSLAETMLAGVLPAALGNLLGSRPKPHDAYGPVAGNGKLDPPPYFTNSLNLKQFRDPHNPDFACYTALVDSNMGVDRLNGVGLLGDWDLLRGDPSGGYSINIRKYQSQPIIDSLGIEAPTKYKDAREGDVVTLRPTFPFWMDVDLYYGVGRVICSRTPNLHKHHWTRGSGAARHAAPENDDAAEPPPKPPAFNTALGAATEPVVGPFHFPDVTLQVYPLLADPAKLAHFIEWSWNRLFAGSEGKPALRLEPLGSYVYMTVSVIGDKGGTMWSNTNNLGWWAEREVAFCIPVKWWSNGELISVAMIEPFVYANMGRAVVTDREVNGRNTMKAEIESPADIWLSPDGPTAPRRLARVRAESFTAMGLGQTAGTRTLLEIDERDPLPPDDIEQWRAVADGWGSVLADDLKRKAWLRATPATRRHIIGVQNLALEALARGAPINRLTLKQYRDAAEMDRVCYQSVVHTRRVITNVRDVREIVRPVHVWMTRLPNHPIVETLGLRVKRVRSDREGVADCLQPIRPFWMRIGVKEHLGSVIATVDPASSPAADESEDADAKREWHSRHSWFKPADTASQSVDQPGQHVPARPVDEPYFRQTSASPVGPHWNEMLPQADRRWLRGAVDVCSRRALTYELAWKKLRLERLPEETLREQMSTRTEFDLFLALLRASDQAAPRAPSDSAAYQPGPESFAAFASALTLERMSSLATAIDAAFTLSPPDEPGAETSRGPLLTNLAAAYLFIERHPVDGNTTLEEKISKTGTFGVGFDALVEAFSGTDEPAGGAAAWLREAGTGELAELLEAIADEIRMHRLPEPGSRDPRELLEAIDRALPPKRETGTAGAEVSEPAETGPVSGDGACLMARLAALERWILTPPVSDGWPWYKLLPDQATESLNNIRLKRFLANYDLDAARCRLVGMTLDFGAWEALSALLRLSEKKPFVELQHDYESAVAHGGAGERMNPTTTLKVVSDAFGVCVDDWRKPDRWRRFSREEARKAIEGVGDIQIVFEAILRDQWERKPARGTVGDALATAPYVHIPTSSVGPIGDDPNDTWAARHGLERWCAPDSDGGGSVSLLVASGAPVGSDAT